MKKKLNQNDSILVNFGKLGDENCTREDLIVRRPETPDEKTKRKRAEEVKDMVKQLEQYKPNH